MSLFFNMLSKFVTVFLPRSKHLLISWLQSPFTVTEFQFYSRVLLRTIAWETASQKALRNFPKEGGREACLYVISAKEDVHSCTHLGKRSLLIIRTRYISVNDFSAYPTLVFLPGEFHGQRSLAGYSPYSHKESNTTKQLTLSLSVWENTRIQVHEKFFLKYI